MIYVNGKEYTSDSLVNNHPPCIHWSVL